MVIKTEAPSVVEHHHQWCNETPAQHYQMTSPPSLFTGPVGPTPASSAAQTSGSEAFSTIHLDHIVEQSAENHLNGDGGDTEQHGVWQQL